MRTRRRRPFGPLEGDSAEVSFETVTKSSTGTSTMKLKLEKGKWKVSP